MAVYETCSTKEKRQERKNKLKLFLQNTRAMAAALLLVFFFVQFLSSGIISVAGLELEVSVSLLGGGKTILNLPPIGSIAAPTHLPPMDFYFTLNNIDLDLLAGSGSFSDSELWLESLAGELLRGMLYYMLQLLMFSFLIGALISLLDSAISPKKKNNLTAVFICGLGVSLVLFSGFGLTALSYDVDGFAEAEFKGILESAPYVADILEDGAALVKDMQSSFDGISRNIGELQGSFAGSAATYEPAGESLTLLHISDIHNNPAAFNFVHQVAEHYDIDLIVDTGDLVDYGTELEINLLKNYVEEMEVPYLFTPGNHESPGAVRAIKSIENVTVLENNIIELNGLKIAGFADPASYSMEMAVPEEEIFKKAALELAELAGEEVDVIATHNPELFRYVRKENNLLLGGHMHRPYVKFEEGYIEINAGTTGASGIRGIENMKLEFSLAVIQFRMEDKRFVPKIADLVVVRQAPAGLKFERFVFEEV